MACVNTRHAYRHERLAFAGVWANAVIVGLKIVLSWKADWTGLIYNRRIDQTFVDNGIGAQAMTRLYCPSITRGILLALFAALFLQALALPQEKVVSCNSKPEGKADSLIAKQRVLSAPSRPIPTRFEFPLGVLNTPKLALPRDTARLTPKQARSVRDAASEVIAPAAIMLKKTQGCGGCCLLWKRMNRRAQPTSPTAVGCESPRFRAACHYRSSSGDPVAGSAGLDSARMIAFMLTSRGPCGRA